ncbi:MAG: VWA domain-containing protein, partial [Planctomycetota bacterium]
EYEIRVQASGFARESLRAATPLWVADDGNAEWRLVSLNSDGLQQLARSGEGAFVEESNAEEVFQKLKPLSNGTVIESDYVLWQSWPWFIAVLCLLAMEWGLRKRAGLI